MCSGRKKPLEALQVQDHRALRRAAAQFPLWQRAWKSGCLPEAYLVLGTLSQLTQLSGKSGGQKLPNQKEHILGTVSWRYETQAAWLPPSAVQAGCSPLA